jgi:hypothetical protein
MDIWRILDMAEAGETNIEIAQMLCENKEKKTSRSSRFVLFVEILEAIILALVAVATAYGGYQAALWDGQQAELYAESSSLDVKANRFVIENDQVTAYNANTLNAWLDAKLQGHDRIAEFYERRFLPEFKIAFNAWIKLDPINNSLAPPGPFYMPEYHSSIMDEANNLTKEALTKFNEGTQARSTADNYIRTTVYLATVLVLMAISQRFEIKSVRAGLIILSFGMLSFGISNLIMLPRM